MVFRGYRWRGGLNWYDIRIGDGPIYAGSDTIDLLVTLTDAALEILGGDVRDGGQVLYNAQASGGAIAIDLGDVAQQTGGGEFALMAEGLSLAGTMELPICVLIAQRPGPATGLPTRTDQQDLLFALHAGHGEFPRAISRFG